MMSTANALSCCVSTDEHYDHPALVTGSPDGPGGVPIPGLLAGLAFAAARPDRPNYAPGIPNVAAPAS